MIHRFVTKGFYTHVFQPKDVHILKSMSRFSTEMHKNNSHYPFEYFASVIPLILPILREGKYTRFVVN